MNNRFISITTHLSTQSQVSSIEQTLIQLGVGKYSRPLRYASNPPSPESSDPLAVVQVSLLENDDKPTSVHIDSSYRSVDPDPNLVVTFDTMDALLKMFLVLKDNYVIH